MPRNFIPAAAPLLAASLAVLPLAISPAVAQAQAQAPGRAWWRQFAAAARRARAAAPGAQAGRPSPVAKP